MGGLENEDPDKSRELIASNKLKIERLNLALPQLQQRVDTIDRETALKEWTKRRQINFVRNQTNFTWNSNRCTRPYLRN